MRLPIERFLLQVVVTDGCWLWKGHLSPLGYGNFWPGSRAMLAHRFAYIAFVGEIPDDYTIDHLCRTRNCVRPSHLDAVPHIVNVQRGLNQVHPVKVSAANRYCRRGHWLDEANTYNDRAGSTRCRQCHAERKRTGRPRGRPKSDIYRAPSLADAGPPASTGSERGLRPPSARVLSEAQ